MSNLRMVTYSSRAAYLSGNRAAYRTTSHVAELPNGQWPAPKFSGHRVIKTLCGKDYSDMELHDGNGTMVRELAPKCLVCAARLTKIIAAAQRRAQKLRLT